MFLPVSSLVLCVSGFPNTGTLMPVCVSLAASLSLPLCISSFFFFFFFFFFFTHTPGIDFAHGAPRGDIAPDQGVPGPGAYEVRMLCVCVCVCGVVGVGCRV